MTPEGLALLTALGFAVSDVLMGQGIRTSTPYTGAVALSFIVGATYGVTLPWVLPNVELSLWGILWFLLVGASQSGLGMFFFYLSMRRIGVARAAVISASAPAFSVGLAILFLSEEPTLFVYLGTILIILGVMAPLRGKEGRGDGQGRYGPGDLIYPLVTALMFGVSPIFRKIGLGYIPSVPFATALTGIGGLATLLLLGPSFPKAERFRFEERAIWLFLAGGLVMAGAQASLFLALRSGLVSIVAPLVYVKPLFVSGIVLLVSRGQSGVGPGVLVGGVLMAVGAWFLLGLR